MGRAGGVEEGARGGGGGGHGHPAGTGAEILIRATAEAHSRSHGRGRRRFGAAPLFAGLLWLAAAAAPAAADEWGWELLKRGGHVALIRHAEAPGTGDPPDFRLDDCSTQRNLSGAGRAQAVRLGQAFARRGVAISRVLSSRWCRCLETAQLAFGRYEAFPPLDSLHGRRERAAGQLAELQAFLAEAPRGATLVMVSHQATIVAFAGVAPASGEILVARLREDGIVEVAARLSPP